MKQISGFFIVFLIVAAFCTLQAQDNMTGDGIYDPSIVPADSAAFRQDGIASWYGTEFEGHPTASGELFNPSQMTAAHPTLPFGTMLRVTNTQNRKQVIVRVNDRGPFVNTRIIDVSRAAAEVLDMISTGTAPVLVELAGEGAAPIPSAASAGPTESDPWIAPIPPAPAQQPTYPAYPAQPPATTQQPAYPAQPPATQQQPAYPAYPAQPSTTQPPVFSAQPPVQPPTSFSSTPAVVKPNIPPLGTNKRYRVQVGAYQSTRNAVEAFDRVKSVGLEPAYERYNDYYRVVISGVPGDDIQNLAGKLGSVGFREVLIREE
ncbi:hypothetical protein AGMMS49942_09800 [Spirochaetia bacterium]|nr:hypothetical protein AGMMS49942_09800 [Spirochaetia bacterium]